MIKNSEPDYISHLFRRIDGTWAFQSNDVHLEGVARRAETFANAFGMASWGRTLGLLHDKGKENPIFQAYIKKNSGYDPSAICVGHPWHAFVGGVIAHRLFHGQGDCLLANPIIAHHAGLYDQDEVKGRVSERVPEGVDTDVRLPQLVPPCFPNFQNKDCHHLVRMLFSCLVDADRLDTEAFMNPEQAALRVRKAGIEDLLEMLRAHLKKVREAAPDTLVNRLRQKVQERCKDAGGLAPGFYSLTVPTGGGKTLSSLLWALEHAAKHGLRRVVIAIPYTSIIVQTAAILKQIFGEENVLEHHSDVAPDTKDDNNDRAPQEERYDEQWTRARLATENWDCPIVVTTNVQLFESMFAASAGTCRKLHNIVRSVVILDEAQMLPMDFLRPVVDALDTYRRLFNVSVLFTTASQPVLQGHIEGSRPAASFDALENVTEIIPKDWQLYEKLRRVKIEIDAAPTTYDSLSARIAGHDRVLCIVATRRDAYELFRRLPDEGLTVHLSRSMCPFHVLQKLNEVKAALRSDTPQPVRVVATALVEAGVDIDFPVVYRQEAGLDSVLQAAGRCNREGRSEELGITHVFSLVGESCYPLGTMTATNEARKSLGGQRDWFAPDTMADYFRQVHCRCQSFDKEGICDELYSAEPQFRTAAEKFRLINDDSVSVGIAFGQGSELAEKIRRGGLTQELARRFSRYQVNIRWYEFEKLRKQGAIEEIAPHCYFAGGIAYNAQCGLLISNKPADEIYIV